MIKKLSFTSYDFVVCIFMYLFARDAHTVCSVSADLSAVYADFMLNIHKFT